MKFLYKYRDYERAINKMLRKTLIYIQLHHFSQMYYKLRLLAGSYINDFLKIILVKKLIYPVYILYNNYTII